MPRSFKPRNIPCCQCGRFFTNQGGLRNHMRLHEKPNLMRRNPTPVASPIVIQAPAVNDDNHGLQDMDVEHMQDDMNQSEGEQEQAPKEYTTRLPCDASGRFLQPGEPPLQNDNCETAPFFPFENRASFELTDLLFRRAQVSGKTINELMEIWAATLPDNVEPPFASTKDLYDTIDAIEDGDVAWESIKVSYAGEVLEDDPATWKHKEYDVWYRNPLSVLRNQLGNPDYASEMDYAPKEVRDENDKRRYCDFMSGDWAWRQADEIAKDRETHGSTFCPVILGSDKTTVSVATGQNEYYPIYISNGLVHNNVRRAHQNALTLLGFLAIPKTDREFSSTEEFRSFKRSLFHQSVEYILLPLKQFMTKPNIVRFGDGHFRRTIYGLGPYIADYPEQVLLGCIVQGWCTRCDAPWNNLDHFHDPGRRAHVLTEALHRADLGKALKEDYGIIPDIMPFTHNFPRADIHELLSPDLLHQIIKGTFKDHLVTWVVEHIQATETPKRAKKIIADIDRRIAAVPPFPGLRRFKEGREFKQWTGDDSKALMKVFLPAITGHCPPQMVRAVGSFLEFCYLVRRSVLDDTDLEMIEKTIKAFHDERLAFEEVRGTNPSGYSLPRQHSITHYALLIKEFGAPNGLCSSITESKHIKAVKEPWRRSNKYEALGQMLLTNQRLDKLAAARVKFAAKGLLRGPINPLVRFLDDDSNFGPAATPTSVGLPQAGTENNEDADDGGDVDGNVLGDVKLANKPIGRAPRHVEGLAHYLGVHQLPDLVARFLYAQITPNFDGALASIPLAQCPKFHSSIWTYPSAVATFYAPSDKSGIFGMYRERIRAVKSWRKGPPHYDCVYVEADSTIRGFSGCLVARVYAFLLVEHRRVRYPCALVSWYSTIGHEPCPDTKMWRVKPDRNRRGKLDYDIIHLDSILRSAHLIGIPDGKKFIPRRFKHTDSLDFFKAFFVNKFIDHHAHEIAF